jgi:8-amino-7-oxononanoate synthase
VLDLPPWDGTGMASTIPAGLRAMMRARGVTFLDDASGLPLVLGELGAGGTSELVIGHAPAIEREDRARIRLSLDTHPYLGDHRLDGVPVLPLAAAADYALAAGRRLAGGPVVLAELELIDGVRLTEAQLLLDIRARGEQRGGALASIDVELASPSGKLHYRARAVPVPRIEAVAQLDRPAALEPAPLPASEFYARHTFHGPLLRGIARIDGLDARTLVGAVRAARPGELGPALRSFVLDPLLVDSSFQLAAYFMLVRHRRAGLPLGFDELRVLAPVAPGATITCIVRLEAASGDLFAGHIDYLDASGALVAQLRGVRGAFKLVEAPAPAPQPRVTSLAAAPQAPPPAPAAAAAPASSQVARTDGEIEPGHYDPAKFPEYLLLRERIDKVKRDGIALPYFHVQERVTNDTTVIAGREMINYSAYNYVGMSGDPVVSRAAIEAIEKFGTSVSASRIASGEKPLHGELERELARFLGTEDCIAMVGGHSTNVTVIGHVVRAGDLVVHDSLAHDSILQGVKLSGARRRPFPHNDWRALDELLANVRGSFNRVLIAIEGVYSMDGDIPDLPRFIEVKKKHKAMLLVDEAHSLGVLGKRGAGLGEHFGVDRNDVEMWMGTMSKTLASCGGYIAGSRALVEYLKYTTPGFVYSVGLPPSNAAAALASLRQLEAHPERVATLAARAKYFLALCKERGLDTGLAVGSAVVPCIVGSSTRCMRLAEALGKRGINVQPIIYPAVEDHLARLRFFMTCTHTEEQLRYTADVLAIELAKLDPAYIIPPSVRVSDQRGTTDAARSRTSFIRKITGRTVER